MIAVIVLLLASGARAGEKPWFCHNLECPDFEAKESTDLYEVRRYPADKWISTTVEGFEYDAALRMGFRRLFAYISGANDGQVKIEMTAPVRVLVHPSEGAFCKSNFTVSFFLPALHQDNPPEPTDEDVFVEQSEAFTAYVTSYGGWNSEDKVVSHAAKLYEAVSAAGLDVHTSMYYSAGYDSPFRLLNRHSEVWLVARSSDAAGASAHPGADRPPTIRRQSGGRIP